MTVPAFSLPSFAKINLSLRIIGRRKDGYHDICTVFQTTSLADKIEFRPADALLLRCDVPGVATDGSNLILRAAGLLRERYHIANGADITLEKRIPSPGGLGGGSSNAAVALVGLSRLWEIEPEVGKLRELAASLGSDVPFFLHGGTAIGTGRGIDIEELPDLECDSMIIVTPDAAVSTGDAFAAVNPPGLTTAESNRILLNYRFWAGSNDLRQMVTANDFEDAVFRTYPDVGLAKRKLLELGALNAGLSGSGASVFGIFENQETRQTALKALGDEANWRSFAVAAVSRAAYREALGIV